MEKKKNISVRFILKNMIHAALLSMASIVVLALLMIVFRSQEFGKAIMALMILVMLYFLLVMGRLRSTATVLKNVMFEHLMKKHLSNDSGDQALSKEQMHVMHKQSLNDSISWKKGLIVNEGAFRSLQKYKPEFARFIRFYNQMSEQPMWAMIFNWKKNVEKRLVNMFKRAPFILKIEPQIQPYVWGRKASESFILRFLGKTLDADLQETPLAELWFGAHPKNPGVIREEDSVMDLDVFAAKTGPQLLGVGKSEMGQLFKVLDAVEPLSVQMHERYKPDSKNECWRVIIDRQALEGAKEDTLISEIFLGFRPIEEIDDNAIRGFKKEYQTCKTDDEKHACFKKNYQQALENGRTDTEGQTIKAFHNLIEVKWINSTIELFINGKKQKAEIKKQIGLDNDMLMINVPGATVHALSYGTIYELQETADKTLRLYDQGRNDPGRQLHIEEAMSKLDFTPRSVFDYIVEPVELDDGTINLIRTPLYSMDEIKLENQTRSVFIGSSYQMLVVAQGEGSLVYKRGSQIETMSLKRGTSLIVPASIGSYQLTTGNQMTLLKAYESTDIEMQQMQKKRGKKFWEEKGFFINS